MGHLAAFPNAVTIRVDTDILLGVLQLRSSALQQLLHQPTHLLHMLREPCGILVWTGGLR